MDKILTDKISHLYEDIVTKLHNRHKLLEDTKEPEGMALIIMSIDEHKKYRHTYGYKVADELLVIVAKELKEYENKERNCVVYKLGEEQFALLMPNYGYDKLSNLAKGIINYFNDFSVDIGEFHIDITVTVGVSDIGNDLLHEALIALDLAYTTKRHYVMYSDLEDPEREYLKNISIQRKIRMALEQDLIVPYFQKIVDRDGKTIKYETLARMIDPENKTKTISPIVFLNFLKSSKYYEKFTIIMINHAFKACKKLDADVSINLDFEDITNPNIVAHLIELLESHTCATVTIELLESQGLEDIEKTKEFCTLLKSYGAKIAIDDFGSGYSNYGYFFNIPFNILKIDGQIIRRVTELKGYWLIQSIVEYAKKMDIFVIAEFVENEEMFTILKKLGIDAYQGYYFDKPRPLNEIVRDI